MSEAIQTSYMGCHFRSRLEARWAVFFDSLGIKWEYELEGFKYKGCNETFFYLPDFYLPEFGAWAEVKPETPDNSTKQKHLFFSLSEQKNLFITLVGSPQMFKLKDYALWSMGTAFFPESLGGEPGLFLANSVNFCQCRDRRKCFFLITDHYIKKGRDGNIHEDFTTVRMLKDSNILVIWWNNRAWEMTDAIGGKWLDEFNYRLGEEVLKACVAARSARFEHGETPNVRK